MALRHGSASGRVRRLRAGWVAGTIRKTFAAVGLAVLLSLSSLAVAQAPGEKGRAPAAEPRVEAGKPVQAPIPAPRAVPGVNELRILGARVFRRAAGKAAERALPALVAAPGRHRTEHVLHDGEVQVGVTPDGTIIRRTMDAIQQARNIVPLARFVRVFPGDTLAKVAAQYKVDLKKLALLNRTVAERTFTAPDIVCIAWIHNVRRGETLERLAGIYRIEPRYLAQLNGLDSHEKLEPGSQITVPGEFKYHYRKHAASYLGLWRYVDESLPPPFNPSSLRMARERLGPGEDLQDFLAKHQVTEDFLRRMNGLGPEEPVKDDRWLLVEYSVKVNEGATLEDVAQHFEVPVERLLELNQLEFGQEELEPGRRVAIPIGDRMHDAVRPRARVPRSKFNVFEVELQTDLSRSPR